MRPNRLLVSGIVVLVTLVVFAAIGLMTLWSPPASGYRGAIYFADRFGVWKMRFPELEPVRLASQDLFDPWGLTLSPDQQWLTYWTYDYTNSQRPGNAQWVLSTQGGTPQKVNRFLGQGGDWFKPHQLVYLDEGGAFLFDPASGRRERAERWEPAMGACCKLIDPSGREAVLQAPGDVSRGYLRLLELNGRAPITITEPYGLGVDVEWSRDGEQVLFEDGPMGKSKLFVWRRSDGMLRQIVGEVSQQARDFMDLAWSPDGRWAAYGETKGGSPWYAVEIATGRVYPIGTEFSHYGTLITWSPDSRAILLWKHLYGTFGWRSGDLLVQGHHIYIVSVPDGEMVDATPRGHVPQAMAWGD